MFLLTLNQQKPFNMTQKNQLQDVKETPAMQCPSAAVPRDAASRASPEENRDQQRISELTHQLEDLTCCLQRLQAEFENYKKRTEREKAELVSYASQEIITNLLPILDSFELALDNHATHEKFLEGMKLIFSQLYATLEKEGLRQINPLNEKFDPYRDEVVLFGASDKPENTITEVLQKGYMLKGRIIRHAKVRIAKKG